MPATARILPWMRKGEYKNSERILKTALWYATIAGGIGAIILGFGAEPLADLLRMPYCKYALAAFAPTIWIMAYLGVLRGYFQGTGNMVPTAISQLGGYHFRYGRREAVGRYNQKNDINVISSCIIAAPLFSDNIN